MKVDHKDLRKRLLNMIEKDVNWHPDIGMARIRAMVENRPDWCLSRQRYWGVPIPVFYCRGCGGKILDHDVIMNLAKRVSKEGVDVWFKKDACELLPENFSCPACNGKELLKENDILDVWFESGVSHQAVLKIRPGLNYPCNLYLEGSDQHRGWFQSAIITAVGIDGIPPYKSVLTHGFIVDGAGKKMSKSLGNVISPQDLMKKYGADILRLWVASSAYADDVRLSEEILKGTADAYRKIRNTFRYLLSNLYDFDPEKDSLAAADLGEIDRWMLSRLGLLMKDVEGYYEKFVFHKVYRAVYNFCVYEISSLYLDISKDVLYTFEKNSQKRRSAQTVMYRILECLVKILSPILSFTTEEVWQSTPILKKCESIHVSDWPDKNYQIEDWIDRALNDKWNTLFQVREIVQKALEQKRGEGVIGGSLDAKVVLSASNEMVFKFLKDNEKILAEFFIISQVEVSAGDTGKKEDTITDVVCSVEKAEGAKCPRCWHYSPSVGRDNDHPEICDKCLENIKM